MTNRSLWLAPLCASLTLLFSACDDGGKEGDACETVDDCEEGLSCANGVCGTACETNDDCLAGEICLADWPGGVCAAACDYNSSAGGSGTYGEPGCEDDSQVCAQWGEAGQLCLRACDDDDECGDAYACTNDGYCRPNCTDDSMCGAGRSCTDAGTCQAGSARTGEPGAACTGDAQCTSGAGPLCAVPANGWPGGNCMSSCADVDGGAAACADSATCIIFDAAIDDSWCLQECQSNFDCRPDYYCQAAGSSSFCMPRCNASATDFCASSGLQCESNSGACVSAGAGGPSNSDIEELGSVQVTANREFGNFSFDVGDDVASFVIAVTSAGGGTSIPYRIAAPNGNEVFNVETLMNSEMRILPYNDGSFGVLYPNSPRLTLSSGRWSFSLYNEGGGGTADVKVIFKRGSRNVASGAIDINAFIITDAFGANPDGDGKFQEMTGAFRENWAEAGLTVGAINVINVTGANRDRFQTITSVDGKDSPYRKMVETLSATVTNDALNFYFVDQIEAGQAGFIILGIAAGIPGIPVLQGNNTSGVAVSTVAIDPSFGLGGAAGLGQTMAHEGGHWLGLYHTTEQPGSLHDPLPDTMECSANKDRDGSGYVDAGECRGSGAQYLMFWEADLNAKEISPNQAYVMLRNPAVK